MFTEANLQEIIHRIYEGNVNYPDSTSTKYLLRRGLINDAVTTWADENINWKELYKSSASGDGDTTLVIGTSAYDLPSDFKAISSFVNVTDSLGTQSYKYKTPDDVLRTLTDDPSARFFYVTGSPNAGYKLNINPTPTETGTVSYNYYKEPTLVTATTDKLDMSKPYFAVYYTLARLYEQDLRNDMIELYEGKAQQVLEQMVIDNEVPPFNNSGRSHDFDYLMNGASFGQ